MPLDPRTTPTRTTTTVDLWKMNEENAKESLTRYHMIKLEKKRPGLEEDIFKNREPWDLATKIQYHDIPQHEIGKMMLETDQEYGTNLADRRAKQPPRLQELIDQTTLSIKADETDNRFDWQLMNFEDHFKLLDHPERTKRERNYKLQPKGSGGMSYTISSASSKGKTKRRYERVAVTLYYKRFPKPGQDFVKLYESLQKRGEDSKAKKDVSNEEPPQVAFPKNTPEQFAFPTNMPQQFAFPADYAPPVPNATRPPMVPQPNLQPIYTTFPAPAMGNLFYQQQRSEPQPAFQPARTYVEPEPRQQGFQPTQLTYADVRQQPQPPDLEPSRFSYTEERPERTSGLQNRQPQQSRPQEQRQPPFQRDIPLRPAKPAAAAEAPPPPPPIPPKPTRYYDQQGNLHVAPGVQVLRDDDAGEGPSRQPGSRVRIRRVPSTQDDYEEDQCNSAGASVDSAPLYTFEAARPKPREPRPRNRSPSPPPRESTRPRPETTRNTGTYYEPLNPFARQSRRSPRPGGDNWSRQARVSPEREVDYSDYSLDSDAELYYPEEPRTQTRQSAKRPENRTRERSRERQREPEGRGQRTEPRYYKYTSPARGTR